MTDLYEFKGLSPISDESVNNKRQRYNDAHSLYTPLYDQSKMHKVDMGAYSEFNPENHLMYRTCKLPEDEAFEVCEFKIKVSYPRKIFK